MAMRRLLVTDGLHEPGLEILSQSGLFELDVRQGVPADELRRILPGYDGALIHVQTKLDCATVDAAAAGSLRYVGCVSVGFDHVDVAACDRGRVTWTTAAGANADSVGDLALAFMLSFARRLPECRDDLRAGRWSRKQLTGFALHEKTLGLLGAGNTGRATALRAKAFGMRVVAYDPKYPPGTSAPGVDAFLSDKAAVLRETDILSVHVPLQADTRYLVARGELGALKRGSFVVNTARGGIVHEEAMREALQSGQIAGYGVDVFETEPLPEGHWARQEPRVVATHHLGGATTSGRQRVARRAAELAIEHFRR